MRNRHPFRRALGAALLAWAGSVAAQPLSTDARALLHWVMYANDHQGSPFVVIDKRQAQLWLFDGSGRPAGSTPVLLGLARGDHSVPGIGERPMKQILPHERTTPAGRFVAEAGVNAGGEDIYWVDYDAAVSMHRVRAAQPAERRLRPLFGQRGGVVYLLPETAPVEQVFATPR